MKLVKIFIFFTFLLAFAVCVSAQSISYPNELKGYEFFRSGKLKGIKLGYSTKEDIRRIFGENCENGCEYNKNWTINIDYFEGISRETTKDNIKQKFVPANEFLSNINSIKLLPKNKISFLKFISSNKLRFSGGGYSCFFGGLGDNANISFDIYQFTETVSYSVCSESTNSICNKGDLITIDYQLPSELEDKFFVLQK
jgi:hypothetical protein